MFKLLLTAVILSINFFSEALAQNASKTLPKAYLGAWIHEGIADKVASCRSITQGGDDDGMLVVSTETFRAYLPQSSCKFSKIHFLENSAVSIEARCGGQVLKETWALNKNLLERRMTRGNQERYVRCQKTPDKNDFIHNKYFIHCFRNFTEEFYSKNIGGNHIVDNDKQLFVERYP